METHTESSRPETPWSETVTLRYEIEADERPSGALVTVISLLTETEPTEIGPLSQYVDLEALDEFLAPTRCEAPWAASVTLAFDTYSLSIDDSEVVVAPRNEDAGRRPS